MEKKATVFEFNSYSFNPYKKRIFFNYKAKFNNSKPVLFTETIILPKTPNIKSANKKLIKKLLEGLHIILGISYYKLYCPSKIKLPYKLSKKEADFWNAVYRKGLGEFFYKNKLDSKISPKFSYVKSPKTTYYSISTTHSKCFLGIGGGKDSIVTAELLKEGGFDVTALSVETNGNSKLIDRIVKVSGLKSFKIRRHLDWQVFQKHQYSGHIPISAIYAFLGVFAAALYGYKYFIVGNEYSSNFGNLKYKGQLVNHQWSKSFDFERLFQDYVKEFITPDVIYFSLLRPFYEIRIAKLFSRMGKKYFKYFSSCNLNFRVFPRKIPRDSETLWCGECPKCVFTFIILSAFLTKRDLLKIFGKNLYQDKNLLPLFKDILGFGKMKPFDCVGTFEETQAAFYLAAKKHKNAFIINYLKKQKLNSRRPASRVSTSRVLFGNVKNQSFKIFSWQRENSVPEQFRFLGMDNALILGYGKEGKATEKYLKKFYPNLKISIADQNWGRTRGRPGSDPDIVVKTPGIPKEKLADTFYTTATNIFFSRVREKNLIIGVTGSKGKSTTASLIYEILKTAGKKTELLGNIGKPMLEALLKPVEEDIIFVLELSSYQLDDIKFSPDIAVVTNLFPEHMDYHRDKKNYYNAKKNIINFQTKNNYLVCNSENKIIAGWLKNYKGIAIPFSKVDLKSSLPGEHNKNNIGAAVAATKTLKIKDSAIKKAIKNFKGLPHRLEFIGEYKGIKFYDDGSSTNPESAISAIEAIKGIDTIFLGGEDRGYDFSQLEKTIKEHKIKNLVLFPDSGKKIIKNKKYFNILNTAKMSEAVKFAYKNTRKRGVCLLSGASPSYSLWKNFEEKGNEFKRYVKKLSR